MFHKIICLLLLAHSVFPEELNSTIPNRPKRYTNIGSRADAAGAVLGIGLKIANIITGDIRVEDTITFHSLAGRYTVSLDCEGHFFKKRCVLNDNENCVMTVSRYQSETVYVTCNLRLSNGKNASKNGVRVAKFVNNRRDYDLYIYGYGFGAYMDNGIPPVCWGWCYFGRW